MEDWFPKIFEDVKNFSPFDGEYISVSELITHELENGIKSTRNYQSLLIDPKLIEFIKPDEINQTTNSSVHPIYDKDYEYKGRSSVFVSKLNGLDKIKPLVYSWESANNTSFQLDPYFLLTYGLTPRITENHIHWDDLSRPKMGIVTSIPKSNYDLPIYSNSFVRIQKDYLQDYLMLRKKVLIQVYSETRILPENEEISELLGKNKYFEKTTKHCHFRIIRIPNSEIFTEVIGYRLLQLGSSIPISKWDSKSKVHSWPGYDENISRLNAKHWNYVYVSDEVLGKYEQDDNYIVYPESGAVSYKNQWSVSRCYRVGRNHLKIELSKLYEGTPDEVITYWNKYAVNENIIDKKQKNIGARSKSLVYTFLEFGELLSSIINGHFDTNFSSQNILNLNRRDLDYYGWYNNKNVKPVTHHLQHKLSKEAFLFRQKELNLFLVENFAERQLRNIIKALGIQVDKFKKTPAEEFRSIRLLNLILNYLGIANESGLNIKLDSDEINSRLERNLKEINLIKLLSALNAMRQLDSHRKDSESEAKLSQALKVFKIDKNECQNNYLTACEIIYEKIDLGFKETYVSLYE